LFHLPAFLIGSQKSTEINKFRQKKKEKEEEKKAFSIML